MPPITEITSVSRHFGGAQSRLTIFLRFEPFDTGTVKIFRGLSLDFDRPRATSKWLHR